MASAALGLALEGRGVLPPSGGGDRVVRLLLDRGGFTATERSAETPPTLRLAVVAQRHPGYPFKTTARTPFDRASAQARKAGADEPVLLADGGMVAEAARWGIYWWEDQLLCAPPLALGILPSVARARIAELVRIVERNADPDRVARRPVFLANAARGIVEVASWDGRAVVASGLTSALAARFWP